MMKNTTTLLLLLLTIHFGSVLAGFSLFGIPLFEGPDFKENFPQTNEHFALRLMQIVERDANGTNVFISPFSIGLCLAMGMAGAVGTTYEQMKNTLGFPESLSTDDIANGYRQLLPELSKNNVTVANAILIHNGSRIVSEFQNILQTLNSKIFITDSNKQTTINRINQWASEKTHGKIPHLLTSIPPETGAILLNTIYFSSTWEHQFSVSQTKLKFFTRPDQFKLVDFMYVLNSFKYGQFEDGEMVELPYQDKSVSMFVFLPQQSSNTSISTFSSLFDESSNKTLSSRISQLKRTRANIKMPLFKLKIDYILKGVLMRLGIINAFFDGNFSLMIDGGKILSLIQVLHKTVLEVDQFGTTAVAATALFTGRISNPRPAKNIDIILNRPFVFWIRENNNGVLFEGVLNAV